MELKTFVAETINQIIDGIEETQEYYGTKNIIINPRRIYTEGGIHYTSTGGIASSERTVQIIDFEVSLGQMEGAEAKGGIGVFFASVGLGAQGKTETESSALNKVRFSVPVAFPHK